MLVLRRADLEAIAGHARVAAPAECCGVLGGKREGAVHRVLEVLACRNVAPHPQAEYLAHPQDQLEAFLRIEDDLGLEVLGVYHSHPRGPPAPSPVDAARAAFLGASYVVLWLAPAAGWGSWRWEPPRGFVPERVAVDGGGFNFDRV